VVEEATFVEQHFFHLFQEIRSDRGLDLWLELPENVENLKNNLTTLRQANLLGLFLHI